MSAFQGVRIEGFHCNYIYNVIGKREQANLVVQQEIDSTRALDFGHHHPTHSPTLPYYIVWILYSEPL